MAGYVLGALRVVLGMNAGKFVSGSRQVQSEYKRLWTNIKELSREISSASVYITTGMFAARKFINVSRGILDVSSAFERGMTNISTLVDTNSESMTMMGDAVDAVGRKTPVAMNELTTALYDVRSAGISAKDSMGVLENSAKLAVAGLGTTQQAVDLVTSSLNAFQLKGDEASRVYDVIFKTVKSGKTTISALAQGFGMVAGTVANANIKLDDYLATVAALTTTGLPAAQAHTQLRAAIAGLTRESKDTKRLFDALGTKSFKNLVAESRSLGTAFERVTRALRGNDAMIVKVFGSIEAYNAVVGIAGAQNKAYRDTVAAMRDGTDAVGEAFEKQNATIWAAMQRLQNNLHSFIVDFGQALKPSVDAWANAIQRITTAFRSLDKPLQEIIAQFGAYTLVVFPAVIAVGFFVNALMTLIPAFKEVGDVMRSFWIVTFGPWARVGMILATAAVSWWMFHDTIKTIWSSLVETVANSIDAIKAKLSEFLADMIHVKDLIANAKFGEAWQALKESIAGGTEQTQVLYDKTKDVHSAWTAFLEDVPPKFNDRFVVPVSKGLSDMEKLIRKQHNEALADAKRIIEEIQTPMEALIAKQWRIKAAFDAGGLSAEQYGRAMAQASAFSAKNMDALASAVSSNLQTIFGDTKAVAIATALINTYQGISKAIADYPPPISFAMAALQAAAGFAQVANIRKTTKGGGGGGTGGGGAAASGVPAGGAQAPQMLVVRGLTAGQLMTGDSVRDLARMLLDFQRDGGQVVLR